ncbi:non-ribosomal peptide synthetase/type I polyketide synthase [Nostoc flagelliforme]|nr:non-ribosomal peptide synthetase/type I polyketide synthase [Nostoc flagelliforme]
MDNFSTFLDILQYRAIHQSEQIAYTFLLNGETESVSLTYQELERKAQAIAVRLQDRVKVPGSRVLLLFPPGLDFITAFFGCLYAGCVAVPAYPPRRNQKLSRLQAIVSDAQASAALTTTSELTSIESQLFRNPKLSAIHWLAIDKIDNDCASDWQDPTANSDTLAFLQYTSGSTGTPKGVMVTHGNLLHNEQIIQSAFGHTHNTIVVGWLPLFHDMGLIGNVLQPLYLGTPCFLMSPVAFLQKPIRWLQAISRYKATTSGGPNFAYELCVRQITSEQRDQLDLSSWEVAFSGAEPIRAETLERFTSTFADCGFRHEAFYPCYGMAETTLFVSGGLKTQPPVISQVKRTALEKNKVIVATDDRSDIQKIVGCGRSWLDTKIALVEPESLTRLTDGQVGEIWVSSPSVASGYWNRPSQTKDTFHAYLDTDEKPYLRTGDLGFLQDGELFITGRLKDLIIILGRNHYPQDIELTVEQSHPALRPSCGAVFSVEIAGVEQLAIVQEVERTHLRKLNGNDAIAAIRKAVAQEHDLQAYAILLLKTGTLPKTSSGKVQRSACRDAFLAGSLDVVADWSVNPQNKAQFQHLESEVESLLQKLKVCELPTVTAESQNPSVVSPQLEPTPATIETTRLDRYETKNKPRLLTREAIESWLVAKVAKHLQMSPQRIDIEEPLAQYGLGSLAAVRISGELQEWLECELSPTLLYDYPSIQTLAKYLAGTSVKKDVTPIKVVPPSSKDNQAIAIIGIGCRFPKANNPEVFWQLLRNGVDGISEVPTSRWDAHAFYEPSRSQRGKMNTRWGGFLEQVDQFDPQFFGISPREAESMDPQQRLLLEVSWEALENAGKAPEKLAGSNTGVFVGISNFDYSQLQINQTTQLDAYTGTGNAFSIAANRLSYFLDLHGPSWAVDTACSSSLVAVHQACQSLRQGECELALAGGVNLILTPQLTITFSQAGMMAVDGRCKTFDADADGYVRGEGCGVVILKRLGDAQRDGDNILAVIKGSAVNQDGRSNGLTAPNGHAQQAVIRQALQNADVAAAEISYIEAHGTGTFLGDPIELNSLKEVLMQERSPGQTCLIGSVKTNIGHLEAAAGIASLIKVVLSMNHGEIPPHLHLKQVNPHISLAGTSLAIATSLQRWSRGIKPLLAGVSSFGFGGTNAHIIVEQAPQESQKPTASDRSLHLLTLSAKNETALKELAQSYVSYLSNHPDAPLADICFTANSGRSHFNHRLAIVTESTTQLSEQLTAFTTGKQASGVINGTVEIANRPKIVFLFTGQGSQYHAMGRKLSETQPTFRKILQQCDQLLKPYLDQSLLEILYGTTETAHLLNETAYTQPALFALEYALAELWRSWGIVPDAVIGHSVGEYVAACVAGVFSLEDGLMLVAERGRLMQSLPHNGEMAVVFAEQEKVVNILTQYEREPSGVARDTSISIAAVNGPNNIVISGLREYVQSAVEQFQSQGITVKPLQVSHAFHSPLMKPILDEFESKAATVNFQAPQIALISNLTGEIFSSGEIPDASYWRRHLREPVQFAAGMNTLAEQGDKVFLEIGPRPTLSGMGKRCLPNVKSTWLPSLQHGQDDWQVLLNSLGILDTQGVEVNWVGYDRDYQRHKISLPTYPFQRKRYWFESDEGRNVNSMDLKNSDTQLVKPQLNTFRKTIHKDTIISQLRNLVAGLLQTDWSEIDVYAPFLEMGADSIVLIEAVRTIENTFGIKVTIRQMFEELTNIDRLASYIEQNQPEVASEEKPTEAEIIAQNDSTQTIQDKAPEPEIAVGTLPQLSQPALPTVTKKPTYVRENGSVKTPVVETGLERIMAQQLQLTSQVISQQLQLLQNNRVVSSTDESQVRFIKTSEPASPANNSLKGTETQEPLSLERITAVGAEGLNSKQQQHLEALIACYTKRTQGSKRAKQSYHHVLSDSRASAGFRPSIKEMVYPIVCDRSVGSRFWDVDGNEYVDITMGFGVHLFGHNPPFVSEALQEQIKLGTQVGPQPSLAGEVAELFCELTGMERVTFCQSGTEAVMTSLRLARTATNRTKVALFSGSFHGHFDGVLARAQLSDDKLVSVPIAPGVSPHMVEDIVVLNYGEPQALEYIEAHAHELAAVLVEPVQSRRPDLQPKEFLQHLRQLTAKAGIVLIFDEIITGFRIHPGGAQAHFGVKADLATYGKIPGGGLPFAAVAGKATFMNGIDGGQWNYGDDSYPEAERTFFAGTFNKHPLALATARAVLKHLKNHGSDLQEQLNQCTAQLAETLNTFFKEERVPIQVVYFGSLFRFSFKKNLDLFFYHLVEKGVYVWEGRTCFLSTAHTNADIQYVIQAVKDSVAQMQAGGFLPERSSNLNGSASNSTNSFLAKSHTLKSPNITKTTNTTQVEPGFWGRRTHKPNVNLSQNTAIRAKRDRSQGISFSLYYFGNYESEFDPNKYNLLFEGAKFADEQGFTALWIPERHFHPFGGFSPNPSVIGAALARETKHIQIRAGSVVLPIHHPIRVAEEWSIVDNLSKGRVGISFASGWHANDFVFAPDSYGKHRELMFQEIETVQKLWRGESLQVRDGTGSDINVKLFPMPMQPDVPIWVTIVNNPDTYIRAGEIGAGVLTNLMGQTIEDLAHNIALYRESLSKHGYDPELSNVTVLLHTFVGENADSIREKARQPFYNYLQSTVGLFQNLVKSQGLKVNVENISQEDTEYILSKAYERYVHTSALIGTPSLCLPIINQLIEIGVDEIACFVDFGVDSDSVLEGLHHLNLLKEHYKKQQDVPKILPSSLTTASSTKEVNSGVEYTIPITEAQKQLWILAQISEEASSAYNVSISLELQGFLNLDVLHQTLEKVVERHEALRTSISTQGNFQQILPFINVEIPFINFSNVEESESKVNEWFNKESQKPFDLTKGPLFRCYVLKLEEQLHLLVMTAHHIVIDGWSMNVILQELAALYSQESQGEVCQLKPPMQFREYINWQEQQSQTEEMAAHESYWLEKFASSTPVLNLPTDRPRPPKKTYRGNRQTLRLNASLYREVKQFSTKKGCTPFMTLLSAYTAFLHRLTNQEDIVVGISSAGRSCAGSEKLVGYCAHLLPIRSCVVENLSFSDYLGKMKGVLLEAYENQDYPFAWLLKQLKLGRDASHSPLIATIFNLDRPVAVPKMFGLETEIFAPPIAFTGFDISFYVIEMGNELVLNCEYNTDLFDAATISRILGYFQTLVEGIITHPEQRLFELPLLSETEQHQLLVEWNNTQADYPQDKCIHQLFEVQTERTPEAVAVIFEDQQLNYRELNARANQLAHHLQTLGVGPEVLVGICVERSIEMVVGLLGILKAGGAYVPLDPSYPQERLSYMLADSGVEVLLTHSELLSSLPSPTARVVCLDSDCSAIEQHSQENLDVGVSADNLAYVIYTSGSTGLPKGAMNTHQGIRNRLLWMQDAYQLTSSDRVLQKTPFSFDVSVWEFFWPLLTGARIVIAKPEGHKDSTYLVNLISTQQITTIHFVPSMLQVFLQEPNCGNCSCLKRVICSGEALPFELTERFFEHFECELHNLYGPTEAAIDVTFWQCQLQENRQLVPIGRPIANTQVYILDKHLQAVPIGVSGELYIGGDGLARGYLNRPELTSEKFIPNPFCDRKSERLYKTGDLARYDSDANIEFLGRIDHQVKIRGFRIELGEIEAVLTKHPKVQEAVVIAREDTPGDKRLVAYVVSNQEQVPITSELRGFLKEKLPDYMVPSVFVMQSVLPLTPNGKLDRKALPTPDLSTSNLEEDFVAPSTPTEQILAKIWMEILGRQQVGIYDNFFDIGGQSLLIIQVGNKVREIFSSHILVTDLFKYPTISSLAKYLSQENNVEQPALAPINELAKKQKEAIKRQKQLIKQKRKANV